MATKSFPFALGSSASPCSAVWRVWTREDEAHVAVQTTLEEVSFTAYPTGRWRIAVGGAVSRWTRPKEFRPGWTRGPDLVIPYISSPSRAAGHDSSAAEPVNWLPPPAPGHQARFTLLFATPRAEVSVWRPGDAQGTQAVAVLPLRTAGALHLCRIDEPLPPEDFAAPKRPGSVVPLEPTETTVVIVSTDQAGRPSLHEFRQAWQGLQDAGQDDPLA